ncbi:MAG TPA: chemotaxis protein CheB [Rudaea sp.]|jgi:two-component system chemotaxis response regulator CheB
MNAPIAGQRGMRDIRAIAIGGSAGGVEALAELLPALTARGMLSIFVVVHQPRDRSSLLPGIFASRCAFAVCEPDDKQVVRPDHIYFAPADYHMLVDAGPRISLSADDLVHHSRPSIDVLFESAADVYAEHLLAIVLSGGNEDGADGALAVRRAGGFVVVQDPETARVPMMPRSALAKVAADAVLPVAEIFALLNELCEKEIVDDR